MRPYQLSPPEGEWLDLDTVQSIEPPRLMSHHGFRWTEEAFGSGHSLPAYISMRWRHAFQSEAREMRVDLYTLVEFTPVLKDPEESEGAWEKRKDERDLRRSKEALAKFSAEVYEPFLAAWGVRQRYVVSRETGETIGPL